MKPFLLRADEPRDDAIVVVRGGEMDSESVRRTAQRNHDEFGFYGVSVFLALDLSVADLCATVVEIAATAR